MVRNIVEMNSRLLLESMLSRMGAEWVAENAALILKSWVDSGHLLPEKSNEIAFSARAFWAAHEEISSLGVVQV